MDEMESDCETAARRMRNKVATECSAELRVEERREQEEDR